MLASLIVISVFDPDDTEVLVKYGKFLAVLPALLLVTAIAIASPGKEFRSFKGTWLCPTCAEMKQADTPENCEAKGHKHALKLDDGQLITFDDNARAATLIHGGGREKAKIEVCGLFEPQARTLDVDAYKIDDTWTTWCDAHARMDQCRSAEESNAPQGKSAKTN
jgi:hypothetical protein